MFNPQQLQAVQAGDGPVVIVAGPGTGKTKTLAARIGYLVNSGVAPGDILALTFTKKSAEELSERLATMLQNNAPKAKTFHALCYELLGQQLHFASEPQRHQIIKGLKKPANLKGLSARDIGLQISLAKNSASPSAAIDKLAKAYDKALRALGLSDYDDLLVRTKELLKQDSAKYQAIKARYKHILVDEFQDTNGLQYELLQLLRGTDNLFVIGDPNQSIYGFRGASGNIFEQFNTDFPHSTHITLTINYRSAPQVVALSNALFNGNLQANGRGPGTVQTVQVLNEYSEANYVINTIQQAIGGSDLHKAVSNADAWAGLRDFAVLYRSRTAATVLQKLIEASGLPYQVVGEGSPYEQPDVQAIIAQLRQVDNNTPPFERAEHIIASSGITPTPQLQQFVASLVRFKTTKQALDYFDQLAEQNFYDPRAEAITLLTIHAAKGLEFNHVFLLAAEEGVLPSSKGDMAEERRLFYVAATRAKKQLDILHAKRRKGQPAQTSRFVLGVADAILPKVVDSQLVSDQRRATKRQAKRAQASLF